MGQDKLSVEDLTAQYLADYKAQAEAAQRAKDVRERPWRRALAVFLLISGVCIWIALANSGFLLGAGALGFFMGLWVGVLGLEAMGLARQPDDEPPF